MPSDWFDVFKWEWSSYHKEYQYHGIIAKDAVYEFLVLALMVLICILLNRAKDEISRDNLRRNGSTTSLRTEVNIGNLTNWLSTTLYTLWCVLTLVTIGMYSLRWIWGYLTAIFENLIETV